MYRRSHPSPHDTLLKTSPVRLEIQDGIQTFTSSSDSPIDFDLLETSRSVWPLLIQCKSLEKDPEYLFCYIALEKKTTVPQVEENLQDILDHTQIDMESCEFSLKVMKQIYQLDGQRFEYFGEVFGTQDSNSTEENQQCVICIAESRNVVLLPCRHLCLCSACAGILRQQSNKCPMCRGVVASIVEIPIPENQ